MNISQLKESKFLKKDDCGSGILVTIDHLTHENVAKEGSDPEMKWAVHFKETDKPMVLNSTNAQLIAGITKSEETDDWTGHKIVLYNDPTVSFGGKVMGGIRVRAPRNQPAKPTQPAPKLAAPVEASDDNVPF